MPNEIEFWDRLYEKNGKNCQSPYTADLHSKILEVIPDDVETILDAGCGGGALMVFLARKDKYKVEGIDLSSSGVRNITEQLGMDAQVGDLSDLRQFADASFDAVICSEVTEHLPADVFAKVAAEMMRVSRRYVITTNPYKEKLKYYQLVCAGCQTLYHPAGHLYSVEEALLRGHFEPLAESVTFHYSGRKEWRSDSFASLLRAGGYQLLGDMDTVCPVCALPEKKSKNWGVHVRVLGRAYRGIQLALKSIGLYGPANIVMVATVRQNMGG